MTEVEKICKEKGIPYTHLDSGEFKELVEMMKARMEKVHRIKVVSRDPFCASVPSELLACDTWILKPFQKTCKQGHRIEYVEEIEVAEGKYVEKIIVDRMKRSITK